MTRQQRVYADTNALFPYYLSDFLLFLAADGAFRLLWTQYLIDEVIEVVPRRFLRTGKGRDEQRVSQQWAAAKRHFRRNEITEAQWRACLIHVSGPDPDDLPHAAAAIAGQADVLVTSDRKGFSKSDLARHGVRVMRPDTFLNELLSADAPNVVATFRRRQRMFTRPSMTEAEYVELLARSVPRFAKALSVHLGVPLTPAARVRAALRRMSARLFVR